MKAEPVHEIDANNLHVAQNNFTVHRRRRDACMSHEQQPADAILIDW